MIDECPDPPPGVDSVTSLHGQTHFPTFLSSENRKHLQNCRLVCKAACAASTSLLFRHLVAVASCVNGRDTARIEALESISQREHLASCVRHVEIGPCCHPSISRCPYHIRDAEAHKSTDMTRCFSAERIATALQAFPKLNTLQYHCGAQNVTRDLWKMALDVPNREQRCAEAFRKHILGNRRLWMPKLQHLEITLANSWNYKYVVPAEIPHDSQRITWITRLAGLRHVSLRSIHARSVSSAVQTSDLSGTIDSLDLLSGTETYQVHNGYSYDRQATHDDYEDHGQLDAFEVGLYLTLRVGRWSGLVNLDLSGVGLKEKHLVNVIAKSENLRTLRLVNIFMVTPWASENFYMDEPAESFGEVEEIDLEGVLIPRAWGQVLNALRKSAKKSLLYMHLEACFTPNDAYKERLYDPDVIEGKAS